MSLSVEEVQTFLSLIAEERIQWELDGATPKEKVLCITLLLNLLYFQSMFSVYIFTSVFFLRWCHGIRGGTTLTTRELFRPLYSGTKLRWKHKPTRTEPYQAVPNRTMQWKSTIIVIMISAESEINQQIKFILPGIIKHQSNEQIQLVKRIHQLEKECL